MADEALNTIRLSDALAKISIPVQVDPKKIYREIGIRSHGKGIFYKEEIKGETIGNKNVFWVEPDCLILNIVFAWERAVARTTSKDRGFIASHRFPMFQVDSAKINLDYLTCFFVTPYGQYLLNLASPGGAGRNKTLGQDNFLKLEIPLPPIAEQNEIAQILSTWDTAIEKIERLIDCSELEFRFFLRNVFSSEKFCRSSALAEIADITMGSSPKSSSYNTNGRGLPLIQGNADIKNRHSAPKQFTSEITKECQQGDILLSVRAPVGKVALSDHRACIGRGIAAIRAKEAQFQLSLYYSLLANESAWKALSQGSTFEAINSSDLRAFGLRIPNFNFVHDIEGLLKSVDQRVSVLKSKREAFLRQKQGLMQQLLSGKKRVAI